MSKTPPDLAIGLFVVVAALFLLSALATAIGAAILVMRIALGL